MDALRVFSFGLGEPKYVRESSETTNERVKYIVFFLSKWMKEKKEHPKDCKKKSPTRENPQTNIKKTLWLEKKRKIRKAATPPPPPQQQNNP